MRDVGLMIDSTLPPAERALWWIVNGDMGVSSKTIFAVMTGAVDVDSPSAWCNYGVPYDRWDYGRCRRLFDLIPEWRPRIAEMAEVFPCWREMVDNGDVMDALYDAGDKGALALCDLLHKSVFGRRPWRLSAPGPR